MRRGLRLRGILRGGRAAGGRLLLLFGGRLGGLRGFGLGRRRGVLLLLRRCLGRIARSGSGRRCVRVSIPFDCIMLAPTSTTRSLGVRRARRSTTVGSSVRSASGCSIRRACTRVVLLPLRNDALVV